MCVCCTFDEPQTVDVAGYRCSTPGFLQEATWLVQTYGDRSRRAHPTRPLRNICQAWGLFDSKAAPFSDCFRHRLSEETQSLCEGDLRGLND